MLDIKMIRNSADELKAVLTRRAIDPGAVDEAASCDARRRALSTRADELRALRNQVSEEIGCKKKKGGDISAESTRMRAVGEEIKKIEEDLLAVEADLTAILERIPNVPHPDVPEGSDDSANLEVSRWGEARQMPFSPKPHWDIAEALDIVDFARAVKLTGSRFVLFKKAGALLERALINFMLDVHTLEHGYVEIFPPFLVNAASMYGTGQLPRFEEDLFKIRDSEYYLIPTSEVPVTNLHRDEILEAADLPLNYAAYSENFRSEAGAAGRDTRGLTRVHQFSKVELVKFTRPEDSYGQLEKMRRDAEDIMQRLGIPYRIMLICLGDLGFSAAKKYDIEFWAPGQNRWVEISSLSNCTDFQARRANIRYRPAPKAKPEYVHTLNGSGVAVGRMVIAILENFQEEDGSVIVPEALRPYMRGLEVIRP
jgi:seryl-tRNA synthetase